MYEYNRISYEAREHAARRAREAGAERIARSVRRAREASLRRHLHDAVGSILARRSRRLARQS